MTPLIEVNSNTAIFKPVTPAQYAKALDDLRSDKRVTAVAGEGNAGTATAEGVDLAWEYDDTEALTITIVKKHGFLMSHAPNATIFDTLQKELNLV
jgi:hypothetical protein